MTISVFDMWLWLKLDDIQALFSVCAIFLGVASVLPIIILVINASVAPDDRPSSRQYIFVGLLCGMAFFCALVATIVPNTKQAAVIYVAPKIINSDFIQKDLPAGADEVVDVAREYFRDLVKDYRGKRKD